MRVREIARARAGPPPFPDRQVLGSHVTEAGSLDRKRIAVAAGDPGDVLFFNGKCVHRGRPNGAATRRDLLYVVYAAKWFEQGRDSKVELADYHSIDPPRGDRSFRT